MKRWRYLILGSLGTLVSTGLIIGKLMLGGCRSTETRIAERLVYGGAGTTRPAEDWPQFRGPRRDGISRETPPSKLSPKQLWSAEVGLGYASPIAAGGRLYLFTLDNRREALTAFDAASGKILWTQHLDAGWAKDYPGTRATPTIAGDRIYTYGGAGDLVCRRLEDGKLLWRVNILAETKSDNLRWGMASCPLVSEGRVYVQGGRDAGAIAVAVEADSGKIAWQSEARGTAGYAQCVMADVEGARQLVVFAGEDVFGMDPQTGKTIWSVPWRTSYEINAATPICRDGYIFITSSYRRGCMMLRPNRAGVEKLWETNAVFAKFQAPILDGDSLFANSEGYAKCLSWPDGAVRWQAPRLDIGNGGSMIRVGDRLLLMGDKGKLVLARATKERFEKLAETELVDDTEIWATPLLYGGRLYVKSTREIACFVLE